MAQTEKQRLAVNAATKRWRERNPEKAKASVKASRQKNRAVFNAARRVWRERNIERSLLNEARARAKNRGVAFTITLEDIPPRGEFCPLLGLPFMRAARGRHPQAPSLDRIDPTKGYIPGNVWIVGYRANLVKNDGTADEHEAIALAVRRALS